MTALVSWDTPGVITFFVDGAAIEDVQLHVGYAELITDELNVGSHVITAEFLPTDPWGSGCVSDPVTVLIDSAVNDEQTVTVEIPAGALMISSPYTPSHPLSLGMAVLDQSTSTFTASGPFEGILIADTRAGEFGFQISAQATEFSSAEGHGFTGVFAGLTDIAGVQVAGNAMKATDLVTTDVHATAPGLADPHVIATYPAGHPLGTVGLRTTLTLAGIPSSLPSGVYTGSIVFTAF